MNRKGFAIIESVIGIAIGLVIIVAFAGLLTQAQKATGATRDAFQAEMYLREGIEVAKDLEQSPAGWTAFATCMAPSLCHPAISGGDWTLQSASETLDGTFNRSISVFSVQRDASNNIVVSGGTVSTTTKKVTATVSWTKAGGATRTITLDTYVYR